MNYIKKIRRTAGQVFQNQAFEKSYTSRYTWLDYVAENFN